MKKSLNYITRILSISLLIIIFSCSLSSDDGDTIEFPDNFTITQVVNFSGGLTILEEAFNITGLDVTLDGTGEFTLFAPSDTAFQNFLAGTSLNDIPVEDLRQLLLNHVIPGAVRAADLSTLQSGYVTTLATNAPNDNNISMYFNTSDGIVLNGGADNNGAAILDGFTDSEATNGIVHIIDDIIELPTVANLAAANPDFSTLISAIGTSGLTTNLIDLLSLPPGGISPFTVFTPNNSAFTDLLTELSISSLDEVDIATLEAILQYHVVQSANTRAEALNKGQVIGTLNGASFTVNLPTNANPTLRDVNDRVSNIVFTNIQGTNGVIHTIDQVLLPN